MLIWKQLLVYSFSYSLLNIISFLKKSYIKQELPVFLHHSYIIDEKWPFLLNFSPKGAAIFFAPCILVLEANIKELLKSWIPDRWCFLPQGGLIFKIKSTAGMLCGIIILSPKIFFILCNSFIYSFIYVSIL